MEENNSKIFIILGSFAVLGAGIYFYFKTKKTPTLGGLNTRNSGAGLTNTGGGSTNTGSSNSNPNETVLSTPEEVIESAKKIAFAKDLAKQINELRIQRNLLASMTPEQYAKKDGGSGSFFRKPFGNYDDYDVSMINQFRNADFKKIDDKIKDLDEQLAKVGYVEMNGSITKIVK